MLLLLVSGGDAVGEDEQHGGGESTEARRSLGRAVAVALRRRDASSRQPQHLPAVADAEAEHGVCPADHHVNERRDGDENMTTDGRRR